MKIAKDKNIKRVDLKDKFEGTTFFFFEPKFEGTT